MLLGSSSEANLRTQPLPRTVRCITGVQALAIKRVGMWVIHQPGTCNPSTTKRTPGNPKAHATTQPGTQPTQGRKGKNKFKAHLAQVLANHNTFGDDTSDILKEIMDKYE